MNRLFTNFALFIPWLFILWLIAQGFDGELSGWLVLILVILLVPMAIFLNIVTLILAKGSGLLMQARKFQKQAQSKSTKSKERVTADNLADLPWYDPRRWWQQ